VQQEDQNRLAMEGGTAAFEINYPFVYPSMKADKPTLFKSFKWTTYPQVSASVPLHSTLGGIDLTVSSFSKHKAIAEQAVLCLRNSANQLEAAVKGGLPPTLTSIYQHPSAEFVQMYPFYKDILAQLTSAAVRPQTPEYQAVSIYVSHLLSPPAGIKPASNLKKLTSEISDALQQKGLIP
jgi:multiple sugar transport system substrate-binding protein